MDLPPPPYLPDHRHNRYGNYIHHSSFPHHLPPPPHPPPYVRLPPSPPPLPRDSLPYHFTVSLPHRSIPVRAYPKEFDSLPKPYPDGFSPKPESFPFRVNNHDYLERSPSFKDEVYNRRCSDNLMDRLPLNSGGRASEHCSNVSDVGAGERFSNAFGYGHGLYNEWDDDERRWDNRISYRGTYLYNESDYAARRCDTVFNNRGRVLYNERIDVERRWNDGVNASGYVMQNARNDDQMIQGYSINDRSCELYSEGADDQRREGYGINGRSYEVYNESTALGFGIFSDRLGRRVSNDEFNKDSKNRRVQKMRALDRIESEQACKKRRKGYNFQHAFKETNNLTSRRGKEKEVFKRLEMRSEDKKEREQSPYELAISFKSNGLVARAILASSSPAGKSNMDLTSRLNSGEVNICSEDMVRTDVLTHGLDTRSNEHGALDGLLKNSNASDNGRLTTDDANDVGEKAMMNENIEDKEVEGANTRGIDTQSDAHGALEELLEKSNASENERLTTNDANHLGENSLANENLKDIKAEGVNNAESGLTSICKLKKEKRAKKAGRKIPEESLELSTVSEKGIEAINIPSFLGVTAAENGTPEKMKSLGTNHVQSRRARARRLRKMRSAQKKPLHGSSLEATNDCGKIMNDTAVPQQNKEVSLLKTDVMLDIVIPPSTGGAVFNEVDLDGDLCNPSLPNSESENSSLTTLPASLCIADSMTTGHPGHTERLESTKTDANSECQLWNDEVAGCANDTTLDGGNIGDSDDADICAWKSDLELNSEANCSLLEKAEKITNSDVDSADAFSKEVLEKHGDINATDERGCDFATVVDHSNANFGSATNSMFPMVDHKENTSEFNTLVPDTMIKQSCENGAALLSDSNGYAVGFLDAANNVKTCVSTDDSPKISRKRKESCDQIDLCGPKINGYISVADVGKVLSKDCISAELIDSHNERNSYEKNDSSSEGPSRSADLNLDSTSGVDGSSRKKKKVDSSRTSGSIDGLTSDHSEHDLGYAALLEWESGSATSTPLHRRGSYDMEIEVGEENYSIADLDTIPTHNDKLHMKDDLVFTANMSSDKNVDCDANSGDELIESDPDARSCPSSPEDLLLFSDFSSPLNAKASPRRNGMIYDTDRTFNRRPVSAEHRTFSLRRSYEKTALNSALTNTLTKPLASQVTRPLVLKSNFIHGKYTLSKDQPPAAPMVFPGYSQNINTSRISPMNQVSNSRTWHRTGSSSIAAIAPKLQTCPPTQVDVTKVSRTPQNSYVRTGNSLVRTPPSSVTSPGFRALSSPIYSPIPSIGGMKKGQTSKSGTDVIAPNLRIKPSPSSVISPRFRALSSSVYRLSASVDGLKKGQTSKSGVDCNDAPSLQRKPSPSSVTSPGFKALSSSVYRPSLSINGLRKSQTSKSLVDGIDAPSVHRMQPVNSSERPESPSLSHSGKSSKSTTYIAGESLPVTNSSRNGFFGNVDILHETMKSSAIPECRNGSGNNSDSQSTLDNGNSGKKIIYVKRKSNQLVAASGFEGTSTSAIEKTRSSLSDGYYKSKKNQLVRTPLANHSTKRDATVDVNLRLGSQVLPPKSSNKRQLGRGFPKTFRSSKFSSVWKLHEDAQSSEKHKISERPLKVLSRLFPWKRATHRRNIMLALGSKPSNKSFSTISQNLLLSRKRGAVYTRSSHGYSLRMSKVFGVGGSSLKWSKSMEKNYKEANEEATQAFAAAEKRKKEEKIGGPIFLKTINYVSRKLVPSVKLRPGERIFRIGSERYKMDPTRRTLHRITAEDKASTSVVLPSERDVKKSYVPRRLFIGNNEYVRVGNGNQLFRDPKKRARVLASEKVRWSLRTARLRWAKKKKYCQFFTKFGKCNKDDGKCPYIHDQTKIVVCTKFLNGSCFNPDCKLTHKVIPERMQDCSYFLKGSCSNEDCPYRHVNVDLDSPVCESFLRGYCADGNECRKKHTYICPAFEANGTCPQASTCKLHHPKKMEKKPTPEEKIVRGRYFDGGLISLIENNNSMDDDASEELLEESDEKVFREGKYPDYISLDVSDDDEMEHDMAAKQEE